MAMTEQVTRALPRGRAVAASLPGGALGWPAAAAVALLAAAALQPDAVTDRLTASIGAASMAPPVTALLLLVLAAVVHFVSAAGSLRAVSARRLSMLQTTYAQLAAGAANRLLPGGVGGAGVNLRYLGRAGLPAGAAASALGALTVVGVVTDALYGAGVTVLGPLVGLPGAATEMRALAVHGAAAGSPYRWALAGLLLILVVVAAVRLRRTLPAAVGRALREAGGHVRALAVRPRYLTAALLASTVTTAVLSLGFVVAVAIFGSSATPLSAGALVALYLVAAALDGASPLPPWLGATELLMVASLTVAGYTAGSSVLAVAAFRAVTYWLPLPLGLWAAGRLRRADLL
jgi:uncharacterized membrane protein YbhN (UPF0104 family)